MTIIDDDVMTARLLGLAPYGADAEITGEGAKAFVEGLRELAVTVRPTRVRIPRARRRRNDVDDGPARRATTAGEAARRGPVEASLVFARTGRW